MSILNKTKYFDSLTGVRAIAAYLVYLHHFNPVNSTLVHPVIYDFIQEFHIGVTIFFVLSGFLITYRYYESDNFNVKKYFVNRFSRIYPMYFLLTTITFIGLIISKCSLNLNDIYIYIMNITLLRGFFDELKFTLIAQGWTLTLEETFYIVAPLIFILIKYSKNLIFILPFMFIIIGIIMVIVFRKFEFYGFFKSFGFMFGYTFFGRCFEFFAGIILALILKAKAINFKFNYFTFSGFVLIIVSVFIMSITKGYANFGIQTKFGFFINTIILPLFGIVPFFYGLIHEKTIFSKLLSSKIFILLGKSSYVFYLIHLGFFHVFLRGFFNNYIFIFLLLNIISILIYRFIENPLCVFFKNKLTLAE